MSEKRDYYEVLGLSKGASEEEIKKHTAKWRKNITRTLIRNRVRKRNLKRSMRHMKYLAIRRRELLTINLAMQVWTVPALADSIRVVQTSLALAALKIFLDLSLAADLVKAIAGPTTDRVKETIASCRCVLISWTQSLARQRRSISKLMSSAKNVMERELTAQAISILVHAATEAAM